MSDPFIGEIRIFAGNFAPRDYAFCNGQTLPIAQNTALFAVVGTIYGGDGRNTFGVPNLQGRAPVHAGQGPGLTHRNLGSTGGAQTDALGTVPAHNHTTQAGNIPGNDNIPTNQYLARPFGYAAYRSDTNQTNMAADILPNQGGGQDFNIVQPYQVLNFIIALQGIFPSRN